MKPALLFLGCSLVLAACGQEGEPEETEITAETLAMDAEPSMSADEGARAEIRDAQGNSLGVVELQNTDFGVLLAGNRERRGLAGMPNELLEVRVGDRAHVEAGEQRVREVDDPEPEAVAAGGCDSLDETRCGEGAELP